MVNTSKKSANKNPEKQMTTHEQRELAHAHNNIFVKSFIQTKLSIAFPLWDSVNVGKEWARGYVLKQAVKEVDGI